MTRITKVALLVLGLTIGIAGVAWAHAPTVVSFTCSSLGTTVTCTVKATHAPVTGMGRITVTTGGGTVVFDSNPGFSGTDKQAGGRCDEALYGADTCQATIAFTVSECGSVSLTLVVYHAQAASTGAIATVVIAPATTSSVSLPAPDGLNGWYVSNVTVTFTVTAGCPGSVVRYKVNGGAQQEGPSGTSIVVTTDGNHTVESWGYWTNGTTAEETPHKFTNFKIDKTPPTLTLAFTPNSPDGDNGWWKTPGGVPFSWTCSDATSGIDPSFGGGCPSPLTGTVTTQGTTNFTDQVRDMAGNLSVVVNRDLRLDNVPPTITGSRTPAANAFGWNNTDVTVSFSCSDATSGISSCGPSPQVVTTEGANQSRTGTAVDKAGNSASATVNGINIDKTPPSLSGSRTPAANAFGWNNTDVTVNFSCSDALSGVDVGPVTPQVVSTEGAGQSRSATCTDKAGNSASATVNGINIDKTPPVAAIALNPATPNGKNGWYTVNVGVDYTCGDVLSGLDPATPCPADTTITSDGIHNLTTGTIKDKAGNQSSASATVKRDATPPTITGSRSPAPNAFGWNNTDVTVSFVCSDATSGVASCGPTPQIVTTEGPNQSRTGVAEDNAGNTASATVGNIHIDKTPPIIVAIVTPPPDASGIVTTEGPVTASFNCSDPLNASNGTPASGIASCSPSSVFTTEGTQTTTGLATDRAGNIATAFVRFIIARQQQMILQVKIKDKEIPPVGEEMTVELILKSATGGLRSYDLLFNVGDLTGGGKIARIEKIESKTIDPRFFEVVNKQDFLVQFKASDNEDKIRPGDTNIVIAVVKLRILLPGRSLVYLASPGATIINDKGQVVDPRNVLMIPQEFEVKPK